MGPGRGRKTSFPSRRRVRNDSINERDRGGKLGPRIDASPGRIRLGAAGCGPAAGAGWIDGAAAQALGFDDVVLGLGHTSAVLVPAILAEAPAVGATGRQM